MHGCPVSLRGSPPAPRTRPPPYAIVSAASLAISFNSPACKLFELKPLRNPMQHDLVTKPFGHVDGWVYPPVGPGLGIEVIDEVVEGYRSEKVLSR